MSVGHVLLAFGLLVFTGLGFILALIVMGYQDTKRRKKDSEDYWH